MLDHYHSERSGTNFEHQSATEFKICTHGSEVCNCRDQRVFFPLVIIAASPLNFSRKQQKKIPSGKWSTAALINFKYKLKSYLSLVSVCAHCKSIFFLPTFKEFGVNSIYRYASTTLLNSQDLRPTISRPKII